jgi:hypothetical protein
VKALIEWLLRLFSPAKVEHDRIHDKAVERIKKYTDPGAPDREHYPLPVATDEVPIAEATTLDLPPEEPKMPNETLWGEFVPFLGPVMMAKYSLKDGQVPEPPPGVTFLKSQSIGRKWTNCSVFTAYFLASGFDIVFTLDQWKHWQLSRSGNEADYGSYGPEVVTEWGVGEMCEKGAVPKGGVFLIQSFTTWPRGHSWLVLDYDEATGKILTLEANTKGSGLDGVGFGGLGPIRSTNAANWKERTSMTWEGRTKNYGQVHMARLAIDHASVLEWLAGQ